MQSIILTAFILCCLSSTIHAQRTEKFSIKEVKQECENLPLEKRTRVSITKFKITTSHSNEPETATKNHGKVMGAISDMAVKIGILGGSGKLATAGAVGVGASEVAANASTTTSEIYDAPPTLGENLSTMLTDALQQVNCFRVLESLAKNSDLTQEIDATNNKYSGKRTPKAGKQLGAQIVATGEILEYSVKDVTKGLFGGKTRKFVKIGFNLKLINPETRDIVASHIFRVESKTGEIKSGIFRTKVQVDPAVAAVMEDAIVQAVEFMAKKRDELHLTQDGEFAGNSNSKKGINTTEITLTDANYSTFSALAIILNNTPKFKSMEKSLSEGVGNYTIQHLGSSDDLLEAMTKKLDTKKYDVVGFDNGKITIKAR